MTIKLSIEQELIYKALFNKYSPEIIKSSKSLKLDPTLIFGYNIFENFPVSATANVKRNLFYYLSNIILHTKFITGLVHVPEQRSGILYGKIGAFVSDIVKRIAPSNEAYSPELVEYFKRFHEKVAEFCVDIIKKFRPSKDAYTPEFVEYLKETIILSLKSSPEDVNRIMELFKSHVSLITLKSASSVTDHRERTSPSQYSVINAVNDIRQKGALALTQKLEKEYIDELCLKLMQIAMNNEINSILPPNSALIKQTKTNLMVLQQASSSDVTMTINSASLKQGGLKPVVVLCACITLFAVIKKHPSAQFLLLLTAFLAFVSYVQGRDLQKRYQYYDDSKEALQERAEQNLKDCLSFGKRDYTIHRENDSITQKIYGFKPMLLCSVPEQSQYNEKEKGKEEDVRPKQLKRWQRNAENTVVSTSSSSKEPELPPHYYRTSAPGQLVFFDPNQVTVVGKAGKQDMTPEIFSKQGYNVYPLSEGRYKLKPTGRKNVRCYGEETTEEINGVKRTVCHVSSLVLKAH